MTETAGRTHAGNPMAKPQKPTAATLKCPLCGHLFKKGNIGVWQHAGAYVNHPDWHPEVHDTNERKRLFEAEFPEVAKSALTANRRVPPSHRDPKNRRLSLRFLHPPAPKVALPDAPPARMPAVGGTITAPAAPLARTMAAVAQGEEGTAAVRALEIAKKLAEVLPFCPTCGRPK